MSSTTRRDPVLPDVVAVKRTDPVYAAHAYLTKVPVAAIEPFMHTFTQPGETVLDPFAGSGMTGVCAAITHRRAVLRDINVLGQHIGANYVNLVDPDRLLSAAASSTTAALDKLGEIYAVRCQSCNRRAVLSRTTWSVILECTQCTSHFNYYGELERAGWSKSEMRCPGCGAAVSTRRSQRVGEQPVLDTISCECDARLRDQPPTNPLVTVSAHDLSYPDLQIGPDRQMFHASALAKHNLDSTTKFFSRRNLTALSALRSAIHEQDDVAIRRKLEFAFTAILARASKRYQWSRKRPLNANNQHYYIAPVYYEWNVFDLFKRKITAVLKSDRYIRSEMAINALMEADGAAAHRLNIEYDIGSADKIELPDNSVDYVFTDPPFGSNIFYSDMTLFQEAWLGYTTDHSCEAVVDRSATQSTRRTAERYEELMARALGECHRVLRPGRWLSLVFSNSSGSMWALVQRAIAAAGFAIDPDRIVLLEKGQRSVKGLASGTENTVTADLVLSMQKAHASRQRLGQAPAGFLDSIIDDVLSAEKSSTPTRLYLNVVREYIRIGYSMESVDLELIAKRLLRRGYKKDAARGTLRIPTARLGRNERRQDRGLE